MRPPTDIERARRGWWARWLERLEIDQAVFFALCLRAWQLMAGAGTVVLITLFFTTEVQGYYYTFASLVALQTFFELGFNVVIINVCSHQWSRLRLDTGGRIAGDPEALSRLVSLGRLIFQWYGVATLLFMTVVGLGGAAFLSQQPATTIAWQQPWMVLVLVAGLQLWVLPLISLLEGCNQVSTVNRFRFVQALSSSLAIWTVMALGGGLWAAVMATAARLICDLYLLCVHYRSFFQPFLRRPTSACINWKTEVWPLQWRLAVGGVFYYFANYLLTPVMFRYHGAEVAGQMGMTWAVLAALQAGALAWMQSRVPRFGMLVARQQYQELDRSFFRLAGLSVAAMAAGGMLYWCFVYGIHAIHHPLAQRVLPPLPTALFVLALIVYQALLCQDYYVRAHHREPYLPVIVFSNLAVGLCVWLLGKHWETTGAALGLLGIYALLRFPLQTAIWWRCRRQWHGQAATKLI